MRCDLHMHSTVSDGSLPVDDLVEAVAQAGVGVFALTDHDSVDGLARARAHAERRGLKLINGVEISTRHDQSELHILGYGFDPEHSLLREKLAVSAPRARRASALGRAASTSSACVSARPTSTASRPAPTQVGPTWRARWSSWVRYATRTRPFGAISATAPRQRTQAGPHAARGDAWIHARAKGRLGASLASPVARQGGFERMVRSSRGWGSTAEEVHPSADTGVRRRIRALARELGMRVSGGSDFTARPRGHRHRARAWAATRSTSRWRGAARMALSVPRSRSAMTRPSTCSCSVRLHRQRRRAARARGGPARDGHGCSPSRAPPSLAPDHRATLAAHRPASPPASLTRSLGRRGRCGHQRGNRVSARGPDRRARSRPRSRVRRRSPTCPSTGGRRAHWPPRRARRSPTRRACAGSASSLPNERGARSARRCCAAPASMAPIGDCTGASCAASTRSRATARARSRAFTSKISRRSCSRREPCAGRRSWSATSRLPRTSRWCSGCAPVTACRCRPRSRGKRCTRHCVPTAPSTAATSEVLGVTLRYHLREGMG